jgi:hypothetical protein
MCVCVCIPIIDAHRDDIVCVCICVCVCLSAQVSACHFFVEILSVNELDSVGWWVYGSGEGGRWQWRGRTKYIQTNSEDLKGTEE